MNAERTDLTRVYNLLGVTNPGMKTKLVMAAFLLSTYRMIDAQINRPCAAYAGKETKVHVHGRLAVYNGGYPNLRVWHIGTPHIFGIFSDETELHCIRHQHCSDAAIETRLPKNVDGLLGNSNPFTVRVSGDFELQPLERFIQGHQQAACIVSARNLVWMKE